MSRNEEFQGGGAPDAHTPYAQPRTKLSAAQQRALEDIQSKGVSANGQHARSTLMALHKQGLVHIETTLTHFRYGMSGKDRSESDVAATPVREGETPRLVTRTNQGGLRIARRYA